MRVLTLVLSRPNEPANILGNILGITGFGKYKEIYLVKTLIYCVCSVCSFIFSIFVL